MDTILYTDKQQKLNYEASKINLQKYNNLNVK